jgi:hypothetical protein
MNSIRTPRGPRNTERQGLCRAGDVVEKLLALYGITDSAPTNPPGKATAPPTLVSPNQQMFPWFGAIETRA